MRWSERRRRWLLLWLLAAWSATPAAQESPRLIGRSALPPEQALELSDRDRQWLWERRVLRVGVAMPDYPPFDILGTGREYEGLSADYVVLVSQLLRLRPEVMTYPHREAAIAALHRGEIDLLGTSNAYEASVRFLLLSLPYADDQSVLVTRDGDRQPFHGAGRRLVMLENYMPTEIVRQLFPDAHASTRPSLLDALGAVSFGQADAFLGNGLAAHYQISKSQLDNLQLASFPPVDMNYFGFALAPGNSRLLSLINSALQSIGDKERLAIWRRWSHGGVTIPSHGPLQLTEAEQRWIAEHPRVTVLIDEQFLPLSYRDVQGRFRGISADLLGRIGQRTGLMFEARSLTPAEDRMGALLRGEADMLAALASGPMLERELGFTRAYLNSSVVLVIPAAAQPPERLARLAGQTVAVIKGSSASAELGRRQSDVQQRDARTTLHALEMLDRGEVSAAVVPLVGVRQLLAQRFGERLKVAMTLPLSPEHIAFATARGALELQSILNKALLAIPPEEMDELARRWRSEVIIADSYWQRYRWVILQSFAGLCLALAISLLWIRSLRRLVRTRDEARDALQQQLHFMRTLIDGTPHALYVRDRSGRLVDCNAAYLRVLGVEREAVLGRRVDEDRSVDGRHARLFQRLFRRVLRRGQAWVGDHPIRLEDGRELTLHHWVLPYQEGVIAGWLDISERQSLLERVQQARDQADQANQAKTAFLATMSHEIRTPMNAMLGMLELALKKADRGVLDRLAIEVASGAARGLLELIGDILDITRIEAGQLTLQPEPTALDAVVRDVLDLFSGQAAVKRLQMQFDLEAEQGLIVLVDPVRLRQVLTNLVGNAIKFTHEGRIDVSLRTQREEGDALRVWLKVRDTGVGIAEADLPRLGQPYQQAANQRHSARTSSGLGLSISQTLCHLMGGHMEIDSALGVGTCAAVHLKLALARLPTAAAPEGAPVPDQVAGLSVLVVDDYPANRMLLTQQLEYLGHKVICADDGREALTLWLRGRFDLVLTDCYMPDLDGYALARAIRHAERRHRRPPCLVLGCTADVQPEVRAACLDAGMDDCLLKPLDLETLSGHLRGLGPAVMPWRQLDGMDLAGLYQLSGTDESLVLALISDLRKSLDEDGEKLRQLRREGDLSMVRDLAHRIKGGARIVKAERLIASCEAVEFAHPPLNDPADPLFDRLALAMSDTAQILAASPTTPTDAARGPHHA